MKEPDESARSAIDRFLFPKDDDKLPRTGIDKFLWGSGESPGLGAVWWGGGTVLSFAGVVILLNERSPWAIVFVALTIWQLWMTKKALARRNF